MQGPKGGSPVYNPLIDTSLDFPGKHHGGCEMVQ